MRAIFRPDRRFPELLKVQFLRFSRQRRHKVISVVAAVVVVVVVTSMHSVDDDVDIFERFRVKTKKCNFLRLFHFRLKCFFSDLKNLTLPRYFEVLVGTALILSLSQSVSTLSLSHSHKLTHTLSLSYTQHSEHTALDVAGKLPMTL